MAVSQAYRAREFGGNAAFLQSGTAGASRDVVIESSAALPTSPAGAWGGARNKADRASEFITLQSAFSFIAAADHAVCIGLPLNRHMTIHWSKMGVSDAKAAAAITAFLKLARDHLAYRGQPFASAWVRENDDGDGSKGSHVHILMHVAPDAVPHFALWRRWLESVSGNGYRTGALLTKRIGGRLRTATSLPEVYQPNLDRLLRYVLKGTAPATAQRLGLARSSAGGRIVGKRVGWSQNLGAKARTSGRKCQRIG